MGGKEKGNLGFSFLELLWHWAPEFCIYDLCEFQLILKYLLKTEKYWSWCSAESSANASIEASFNAKLNILFEYDACAPFQLTIKSHILESYLMRNTMSVLLERVMSRTVIFYRRYLAKKDLSHIGLKKTCIFFLLVSPMS